LITPFKTSPHRQALEAAIFSPGPLPVSGTMRRYWFSTTQRSSASRRRTIAIACRMSSGSNPATTIGFL
jgi:hypothetical protein